MSLTNIVFMVHVDLMEVFVGAGISKLWPIAMSSPQPIFVNGDLLKQT
jgi:hypothetical protein